MKDADGNKYYTDKEKCNLMGKSWKSIFRITEEEANFDKDHSNHINNCINIQHKKITPFPAVDLQRLAKDNIYTMKIYRLKIIRSPSIKKPAHTRHQETFPHQTSRNLPTPDVKKPAHTTK